MDHHVREFFRPSSGESPSGNFYRVIALHECPDIDWSTISKKVPTLIKPWYELAFLNSRDRIEFIHDFWISKIPFHPALMSFLDKFFDDLGDIGIFITQQRSEDPFEPTLVYSPKEGDRFFRGKLPASDVDLWQLKRAFPDFVLPEDYLAFLQVHNGFSKTTDTTGIIPSFSMRSTYQYFQERVIGEGIVTSGGVPIDPGQLIPFYESFGMPFFQCFYGEWYPEQEMGNVYYSGTTRAISDIKKNLGAETLSFPSFSDWLIFYLESVD